jgi:hypothetical protein
VKCREESREVHKVSLADVTVRVENLPGHLLTIFRLVHGEAISTVASLSLRQAWDLFGSEAAPSGSRVRTKRRKT